MSTTEIPLHEIDADVQAMLDASRGDEHALSALIEKHYGGVLRYCFRHVRDFAAAEELAQEVFLRVHRSRSTYRPSARFKTWLYRITANIVMNWVRDTARERACERLDAPRQEGPALEIRDSAPLADDGMMRQALVTSVRRAVEALPERQRTVVVLHKFENMAGPDIAETLGCSHQAVRSHLFRAYAALRTRLATVQ